MTVKGKTVAYLYDEELGNYSYGGGNPMRPHRVRLTHSLVENYGLGSRMIQHRPTWQTQDDISQFHADGELCCSFDFGRCLCSRYTHKQHLHTSASTDMWHSISQHQHSQHAQHVGLP